MYFRRLCFELVTKASWCYLRSGNLNCCFSAGSYSLFKKDIWTFHCSGRKVHEHWK